MVNSMATADKKTTSKKDTQKNMGNFIESSNFIPFLVVNLQKMNSHGEHCYCSDDVGVCWLEFLNINQIRSIRKNHSYTGSAVASGYQDALQEIAAFVKDNKYEQYAYQMFAEDNKLELTTLEVTSGRDRIVVGNFINIASIS